MPTGLKCVVTVMSLSITVTFVLLILGVMGIGKIGDWQSPATAVGLAIKIPVLFGLINRSRWAWTAARVLMLVAMLASILAMVLAVIAASVMHNLLFLMRLIPEGIVFALELALFLALGHQEVRRAFARRYG